MQVEKDIEYCDDREFDQAFSVAVHGDVYGSKTSTQWPDYITIHHNDTDFKLEPSSVSGICKMLDQTMGGSLGAAEKQWTEIIKHDIKIDCLPILQHVNILSSNQKVIEAVEKWFQEKYGSKWELQWHFADREMYDMHTGPYGKTILDIYRRSWR